MFSCQRSPGVHTYAAARPVDLARVSTVCGDAMRLRDLQGRLVAWQ